MKLQATRLAGTSFGLLVILGACAAQGPAPSATGGGVAGPATQSAAPAQQPSDALAYPEGRAITIIAPFAAGGSLDAHARQLAPLLEADLGAPVQVVNVPGAGSQIGLTDLTNATPDGHTLLMVALPGALPTYLDPTRNASYTREDIQPIANQVTDSIAIAVKSDSPFNSVDDLIAAAQAEPDRITVGVSGLLGTDHLGVLQFQESTDTTLAVTPFDGSGPALTALLGGHIDVQFGNASNFGEHVRSGGVRLLGVMDAEENPVFPGVPTLKSLGHDIVFASSRGLIAPAGTPPEIIERLNQAVRTASEKPNFVDTVQATGVKLDYLDTEAYSAYWDELEAQVDDLLKLVPAP